MVIRFFTGFFGWLSGGALVLAAKAWLPRQAYWRFAVRATALLWFIPALQVRPSSEGLAASFFYLGFSLGIFLWYRGRARAGGGAFLWTFSGLLLGLSFEFRFQMALMIVGWFAWLVVMKRALAPVCLGVLGWGFSFGFGRLVDAWGYGEWVLSPWRYFSYNLVRGEVSRYGQAPWWDVFRMSFTESWPLLGFIVAVAAIIGWVRFFKSPLTFAHVPFFLVHEVIRHKELRFFFPIAASAPVLLAMAFYGADLWPRSKAWRWRFYRLVAGLLIFNNCVGLVALCFVPFARTVQFYEGVYHEIGSQQSPPSQEANQEFRLLYRERDPFEVLATPIYFYRPKNLTTEKIPSFDQIETRLQEGGRPIWLFEPGFSLPKDAGPLQAQCERRFQTLPEWVRRLDWNGLLDRVNVWSLYRCR
jgi:phosphatidylinositol glycan class B